MHRVALTLDQVRQFGVPSTPLKDTERRGDRWRRAIGHEQTEIDALAALRPDDLEAIARAAVEPFYDFTLAARCRQAGDAWYADAQAKLTDHPDVIDMESKISAAHDIVEKAIDTLHEVQSDTYSELWHKLDIADTSIPVPEAEVTVPIGATAVLDRR